MYRHVKDKYGNTMPFYHPPLMRRLDDVPPVDSGEHIDVKNKRLRNVADPEDDLDSVNKRFLMQLEYVEKKDFQELKDTVDSWQKTTFPALQTIVQELQSSLQVLQQQHKLNAPTQTARQ